MVVTYMVEQTTEKPMCQKTVEIDLIKSNQPYCINHCLCKVNHNAISEKIMATHDTNHNLVGSITGHHQEFSGRGFTGIKHLPVNWGPLTLCRCSLII